MLHPLAVSAFLGFWASLYLLDRGLRSNPYTLGPYSELLLRLGCSVHVLQLRWYTDRFNRWFHRIASFGWFPWRLWFSIGILFASVSMLLSVALLSLLAFNTLSRKPIENQVLTPVMPGVNLPLSQLGFYLVTLLVCGVLHEAGHAVAALCERVRVSGFGLFVLGIYPGAFVDLPTVELQCLSPFRQLRIYCAGVWHNGVLVLVALLLLRSMPTLMAPTYRLNQGVAVTFLQERSVITGKRGLFLGDTVTQLNNCPVLNTQDWFRCIEANRQQRAGHCLSWQSLRQLDVGLASRTAGPTAPKGSGSSSSTDCCRQNLSASHLCFEALAKPAAGRKQPLSACLPARTLSERPSCIQPSDCPPQALCLAPRTSPNASTRLIRIVHTRRPPILFFGDPLDLAYFVGVSDFVPRAAVVPLNWPYFFETVCKYVISLSGALALINVVPCFALDGQFILSGLLELGFGRGAASRQTRQTLYSLIVTFGTILLLINILLALWFLCVASIT